MLRKFVAKVWNLNENEFRAFSEKPIVQTGENKLNKFSLNLIARCFRDCTGFYQYANTKNPVQKHLRNLQMPNKNMFSAQKYFAIWLILHPLVEFSTASCPGGWTNLLSACYKAVPGLYDAATADATCQSLNANAHLPAFPSVVEWLEYIAIYW